jgi:hypothetical protein
MYRTLLLFHWRWFVSLKMVCCPFVKFTHTTISTESLQVWKLFAALDRRNQPWLPLCSVFGIPQWFVLCASHPSHEYLAPPLPFFKKRSYTTGNLSFWLFNILFESWRNKMKQTYLKLPLLRYNYIILLWMFVNFLCAECKETVFSMTHPAAPEQRAATPRLRQLLLRHRHRGGAGHFAQPAMGHGSGLWGAPFRTPPRTPKLGSECLFFFWGEIHG